MPGAAQDRSSADARCARPCRQQRQVRRDGHCPAARPQQTYSGCQGPAKAARPESPVTAATGRRRTKGSEMASREQGLRRARGITVGLAAASVLGAGGIALALDHTRANPATTPAVTVTTGDAERSSGDGSSSARTTDGGTGIGSAAGSRPDATSSGS